MLPKEKTTASARPKGKAKSKGGRVTTEDDSSSDDMDSLQIHDESYAEEGAEENPEDPKGKGNKRKKVETVSLKSEDEEGVMEWYREHPMFYDNAKRDFKNKALKDRIMGDKAKELKLTSKYIKKNVKTCFY